jgi:hypothetical protein
MTKIDFNMFLKRVYSPVFLSGLLTVLIFGIIVSASCTKEETNNNNPVDLDNCPNYTNKTVTEVISYFTGCGKVWVGAKSDFEPYKSDRYKYKFKSSTDLLVYDDVAVPHNTYPYRAFEVFEKDGEVLIRFTPFTAKDTSVFVRDTFRVNIIAKDKVELVNYSWKDADGKYNTGRLTVYKGLLQPDFDKPSGSSGSGSGGYSCPSKHVDPTTDGQLNSWCEAAYVYRCVNKASVTSSQLKYVCDAYKQLKYAGAPDCPHCAGVN